MQRSKREQATFERLQLLMSDIRTWLDNYPPPPPGDSVDVWFRYADAFRTDLGNLSMHISFLACLLAKDYLCNILPLPDFDVSLKAQGARGLDIDATTIAGERVIAEIKTTRPYLETQCGANQRDSILKDLTKPKRTQAEYTDRRSHMMATQSLAIELGCFCPVLLCDTVP